MHTILYKFPPPNKGILFLYGEVQSLIFYLYYCVKHVFIAFSILKENYIKKEKRK